MIGFGNVVMEFGVGQVDLGSRKFFCSKDCVETLRLPGFRGCQWGFWGDWSLIDRFWACTGSFGDWARLVFVCGFGVWGGTGWVHTLTGCVFLLGRLC